jgi:hypothetical protein
MNENSLANELFKELQLSCKRWFIAFVIMIVVEVATIAGFLWYISLPVDETSYYEQEAEQNETDNSKITQSINGTTHE